MARTKRQAAYKKAHSALTAMTLLTFSVVEELRAGQRLHPSRQGAYAKRASKLLREVMRQADEVNMAMLPVVKFVPYEKRGKKGKRNGRA